MKDLVSRLVVFVDEVNKVLLSTVTEEVVHVPRRAPNPDSTMIHVQPLKKSEMQASRSIVYWNLYSFLLALVCTRPRNRRRRAWDLRLVDAMFGLNYRFYGRNSLLPMPESFPRSRTRYASQVC